MRVFRYKHVSVHRWRAEVNFQELVFSFRHCVPGLQFRFIRQVLFYPRKHFADLDFFFLTKEISVSVYIRALYDQVI